MVLIFGLCLEMLANFWMVLAHGYGIEGVVTMILECYETISTIPLVRSLTHIWVKSDGIVLTSTHHSSSGSEALSFDLCLEMQSTTSF